jgi:hypothetical protein
VYSDWYGFIAEVGVVAHTSESLIRRVISSPFHQLRVSEESIELVPPQAALGLMREEELSRHVHQQRVQLELQPAALGDGELIR